MTANRTIVPGEIEGFLSSCPFCTSRRIGVSEIGTRFRIISGLDAGVQGTVVAWNINMERPEDQFMAQLDNESPHCQTLICLAQKMMQVFPFTAIPSWAPPLNMADAAELDGRVVSFCHSSFSKGKWKTDWSSFNEIIRTAWRKRILLDSEELWAVLWAHGVPENTKLDLLDFFKKGEALLIYSTGKGSQKRRKVEPLSIPANNLMQPTRYTRG